MRVYLSGKVTGTDDFKEKFARTEARFDRQVDVINPIKITEKLPSDFTHEEYMRVCLSILDSCDAIAVIDGLGESDGVNKEVVRALKLGIPVIPLYGKNAEQRFSGEQTGKPSESVSPDKTYNAAGYGFDKGEPLPHNTHYER